MRAGEEIYYASRKNIKNAEVPQYENPEKILTRFNYFSVMPASSSGNLAIMRYGEDIDNVWIAKANANAFQGKIKEGDLFWIDGEHPDEEIEKTHFVGASANAVVRNVSNFASTISITLTRNKNQVKK
jgi:hypothetical protein